MKNEYILELKNITKVFPGVKALDNVHLSVKPGEVHALCGENGAGKSTLMKIISGAQTATSGDIYFEGKKVTYSTTKEAQNIGISMIYQEFNLVPYLSVAENIFMGKLPTKNGIVDWNKLYKSTQKILDRLQLKISPKTTVSNLTVGEMQMVEISKCLSTDSKVIIMDEPTAALTEQEIATLFKIIESLTSQGIAIIYISHRMDEIFEISDTITVFRDGKHIKTMKTSDTNYDEIVSLMVGQNIEKLYPDREKVSDEIVLKVENLSGRNVHNVSFHLKKGEILGIYGLMGAGNIELSKILYGALRKESGKVEVNGKELHCTKPLEAIEKGIGLVPDDRKNEGLVLIRSVKENISLASLKRITKSGILDRIAERNAVKNSIDSMNIKVSSPEQLVGNLSGGNQQKVVLSKVLRASPDILILDEPTRGVDVGARAEIYQIIDILTKQDKSIIMVSTDLTEILGMSDRVLIMKEGRIVKEVLRKDFSQELVIAYASGGIKGE